MSESSVLRAPSPNYLTICSEKEFFLNKIGEIGKPVGRKDEAVIFQCKIFVNNQDLLFQYFNSFYQTDQSQTCRTHKSCTDCVHPIKSQADLCRPITAVHPKTSTNHKAALDSLRPIREDEVASEPRARSEQNLRRLFRRHTNVLREKNL